MTYQKNKFVKSDKADFRASMNLLTSHFFDLQIATDNTIIHNVDIKDVVDFKALENFFIKASYEGKVVKGT